MGYLAITRGAVHERHIRTCLRCKPGSQTGSILGPCRLGMALAARADTALAALEDFPAHDPSRATAPATLW